MKLLFVFTGGTIGTAASESTLSLDKEKPYALLKEYAVRYPVDFTYDTRSPFYELSENLTGEHISAILQTVSLQIEGYDGVIVTHGTDTLGYTAAALGYALGSDCAPICLVSAAYPIEDARSNAVANLHAAVTLIRTRAHRGVFVPYRDEGKDIVFIHRATRLDATLPFSGALCSTGNVPYGSVRAGIFTKNPAYAEAPDALDAPPLALTAQAPVLRVGAYPGMHYPAIPDGVRAILLDAYHSGTVNTKSEAAHAFLREARERRIPVFLTGATGGAMYESTHALGAYGVIPLVRISPIAAYMKLWLFADADGALMHASRGGDLF